MSDKKEKVAGKKVVKKAVLDEKKTVVTPPSNITSSAPPVERERRYVQSDWMGQVEMEYNHASERYEAPDARQYDPRY